MVAKTASSTLLLLQSIIALCVWALVALAFWPGFVELRATMAAAEPVPGSMLLAGGLVLLLEVIVMAFAIQRLTLFLRARADHGEGGE